MNAVAAKVLRELPTQRVRAGVASRKVARGDWTLPSLSGCLCELSGEGASAVLTLAMALVLDAQTRAEPVAWIGGVESSFYPPDAKDMGVDLDALVVVRASGLSAQLRAAGQLARSGAFGLLVMDLEGDSDIPIPVQTHLVGLAQHHDMALLFLTGKRREVASIGSLISIRAEARRSPSEEDDGFLCEVEVLKDKRRGPGWTHSECFLGPEGLG